MMLGIRACTESTKNAPRYAEADTRDKKLEEPGKTATSL